LGRHAVLDGYSRRGGVSHILVIVVVGVVGVVIIGSRAADPKFCAFGAVGVVGFVRVAAVGAADWRVGAGRALFTGREAAWVVFGAVWAGADGTDWLIFAEVGRVSIFLAVSALSAGSKGDVFFDSAFAVAED